MNKPKRVHGIMNLVALTLCCVSCSMLREISGGRQRLDAALNHDGWKLTQIRLVDSYLDFEGTMVVETDMNCPIWTGQLRFCMLERRITVQDMRDGENTPEDRKRQLIAGSPQALHLAQAMADFIPYDHGRDAVNATVLRELLRGNREVKAHDLWMTWWVDKPESEAQRVLRKLEAKRLGR